MLAAVSRACRSAQVAWLSGNSDLFVFQSYNDYMRDYHHNVGPPAPWQTLVGLFDLSLMAGVIDDGLNE